MVAWIGWEWLNCEKWPDSEYILNFEPSEFGNGCNVGYRRNF